MTSEKKSMINNKKDFYEGPASELSFFTVNEIIKGYSNME